MGVVVNPYRRVVEARRSSSVDDQQGLRSALNDVMDLLPQAWQGGLSSRVLELLAGVRWDAGVTADRVDGEFSSVITTEPYWVEEDAWQIHWRWYV